MGFHDLNVILEKKQLKTKQNKIVKIKYNAKKVCFSIMSIIMCSDEPFKDTNSCFINEIYFLFVKHFYCIKLCICNNSKNTFVTLLAFLCYVQYASCPNWARVTYAGATLETSVVD